MKILFQKIKEKLNNDVPELTVGLYNNQFNNLELFNIIYPAVFMGLDDGGIDYTSSNTVQYGNTTVVIYLAVQIFDDSQLDVFDLSAKVYKSLHGYSFEDKFSSLIRVKEYIDDDFTNQYVFKMLFETQIKDDNATPDYLQATITDIIPTVIVSDGTDF